MKHIKTNKKGFTLIELLVVIAIIAVLAVVVILTLNPAELLRQARDSNRISDLGTLKSAISLFQADVSTSSLSAIGAYGTLYVNTGGCGGIATSTCNYGATAPINSQWGFATGSIAPGGVSTGATSTQRNVNGTGWVPVNFNAISSGSPIGNLPVDPLNTASNTYAYVASSTSFKAATKVESTKYTTGGGSDVASTDGGNSSSTFESGTKLDL
ncbi:MAG: type II secretion system protein [Candidatus Liptonbacteria bacterium]|nr:type II secretion system protein [Candidatus Liptonbacteria bacterium]